MSLPDFDHLVKLAKENPQQFEELRHYYSQKIIDTASHLQKNKLRGIMFKISMLKQRSQNPTHYCVLLSSLMMDSYTELYESLNQTHKLTQTFECVNKKPESNVLQFNLNKTSDLV